MNITFSPKVTISITPGIVSPGGVGILLLALKVLGFL